MGRTKGEEKAMLVSPLDSFGSKGSDEERYEKCKMDKARSLRGNRWRLRARGRHLTLGAARIINRWPDHLMMCWLIAMASLMMVVALLLMLAGAAGRTPGPLSALSLHQRCVFRHNLSQGRAEKTNVFLHVILNDKETFDPEEHRPALASAARLHPNHAINIFVLHNDTRESRYRRNTRFRDWELLHRRLDRYKFFESPSNEDDHNDLTPLGTSGAMSGLDNVYIVRSTFSNYFLHSPLKFVWKTIACEMIPFTLRLLSLWEHGGTTMPWQMFLDKTEVKIKHNKLHKLIEKLKQKFPAGLKKPEDIVEAKKAMMKDIQNVVDFGGMSIETVINVTSSEERRFMALNNKRKALLPPVKKPATQQPAANSTLQLPARAKDRSKSHEKIPNVEAVHKLVEDVSKSTAISKGSALDKASSSSSSYYSSSQFDGLPDSMESHSPEFGLKPHVDASMLVQNEVKRFVKPPDGKPKVVDQTKGRVKRDLSNVSAPQPVPSSGEHTRHNSTDAATQQSEPHVASTHKEIKINNVTERIVIESKPYRVNLLSDEIIASNITRKVKVIRNPYEDLSGDAPSVNVALRNLTITLNEEPRRSTHQKPLLDLQNESNGEKPVATSEYETDYFVASVNTMSDSSSEHTLRDVIGGISAKVRRPKKAFREKSKFRNMRIFESFNVFSLPNKIRLSMDRFGYYFSTKKPCHAFLGQLVSILQRGENLGSLREPSELITQGLGYFCKTKQFSRCPGLSLL